MRIRSRCFSVEVKRRRGFEFCDNLHAFILHANLICPKYSILENFACRLTLQRSMLMLLLTF
uniref:Uncharacterized protein n=1 Tax=Parascaris equorum TaxID=6256 RepID=A0A914S2X5_PAREQ